MNSAEQLDLLIAKAKETGVLSERLRIIQLANNRICFDHKNGCDHAACYALSELNTVIKGEQK